MMSSFQGHGATPAGAVHQPEQMAGFVEGLFAGALDEDLAVGREAIKFLPKARQGNARFIEHGVPGGAGDALGEFVRLQEHGVKELFFLGGYVDQPGNRRHDENDRRDGKDRFPGETPQHNRYL
jgi:hypothetical protein